VARAHFDSATNMTDRLAALTVLAHHFPDTADASDVLAAFEQRFGDNPLVMDKWFTVQASTPRTNALEQVQALTLHPAFVRQSQQGAIVDRRIFDSEPSGIQSRGRRRLSLPGGNSGGDRQRQFEACGAIGDGAARLAVIGIWPQGQGARGAVPAGGDQGSFHRCPGHRGADAAMSLGICRKLDRIRKDFLTTPRQGESLLIL
jgi:hypothetical protein